MFERFTDRARKVMALANQEAQRFNHEYIGTEHILLGLVKEGSGVGANVLKNLDVDLRKVRLEVEKLVNELGAEETAAREAARKDPQRIILEALRSGALFEDESNLPPVAAGPSEDAASAPLQGQPEQRGRGRQCVEERVTFGLHGRERLDPKPSRRAGRQRYYRLRSGIAQGPVSDAQPSPGGLSGWHTIQHPLADDQRSAIGGDLAQARDARASGEGGLRHERLREGDRRPRRRNGDRRGLALPAIGVEAVDV